MGKKIRTYHDLLDHGNETSAYLFGLWLADGNIFLSTSRGGRRVQKSFAIINTDVQLMRMIGKLFGKKPCQRWDGNPKHKPCFTLKVKSDRLFDVCYSHTGSTPKSDQSLSVPDISKELFHHFVRGFFDGDGSIGFKRYRNRHGKPVSALTTSFSAGLATGDFLERLRDRIRLHTPVGLKKVNTGKTSRKLVFNQYDSMLLCEWMYRNATLFMARKKAVWDSADKERLTKSRK
ncbi:hypothetical protein LCGC14_3077940, partial [marine sediment metagenome]